jgi:predicted DNA-binding protein YlxM (UPF0122 family)
LVYTLKAVRILAKDLSVSVLLDFYGELLTPKQAESLDLYYNQDLSLAEIAEDTGVSRQGVRAFIKQGEAHLMNFEEKLGMAKRFEDIQANLEKAIIALHKIAERSGETETEIYSVADFLSKINL